MNNKHMIGAVVVLVLLAGVGWAMGLFSDDAELAEAEKMRDDLLQKVETMTDEERRSEFGTLREKVESFTEEQKRNFRNGMRQFFMQRIDSMLAMPPEEQKQELDNWIDRMESFRKNRSARDGGGARGGDRGAGMTSAERDQRRKERLDRTTPAMRAKMDRVKDLINERRQERGLEPISGGRGMFGGRGR